MLVLQSHMSRNVLQNAITKSSAFHTNEKIAIILIPVKETFQAFFYWSSKIILLLLYFLTQFYLYSLQCDDNQLCIILASSQHTLECSIENLPNILMSRVLLGPMMPKSFYDFFISFL